MASLRSIILDNRFGSRPGLTAEQDEQELVRAGHIMEVLRSSDIILVNATQVASDLTQAIHDGIDVADHARIPCPKPPFHRMWIECYNHVRSGVLVYRCDMAPGEDPLQALPWEMGEDVKNFAVFQKLRHQQPATIVVMWVWQEIPAHNAAMFLGEILYWLTSAGDWLNGTVFPWPVPERQDKLDEASDFLESFLIWILHTFARLNCHNVKLVPMKAGAPSAKQLRKPRVPATVWHEIVVEDPQLRSERNAAPSGEKREIRFHKVRGHYADYTKGAGLFGKYKVRLWVEEHARGNRERGEVVGSYTVQ